MTSEHRARAMIAVFGSKVGREELGEIADCLERQWLGSGPKTLAFETEFARRLGLPNLVAVNNGSNALYAAVTLLALPPGSDVVVPSFTWVACAHAIRLAGHRPVFCDVDPETQNPTADTVTAAMTPATRAILVVHYAGLPVDMPAILALGLPVIEDAAHAVDSAIAGRACGSFGAVGVYSFDAVKNLTMGEGGALTCAPALAERARRLRYCGIAKSGFDASTETASRVTDAPSRWWEHTITDCFPKLVPSDLNAAVGLAQLRKLDALQAERKRIWETYQREFADLDWLRRPVEVRPGDRHSYFTYVVRMPHRDRSARILYEQGIYTTLRYHPLHLNPLYVSQARLPHTEQLNAEALSLPLHPNLTLSDVDRVVTAVRNLPRSW